MKKSGGEEKVVDHLVEDPVVYKQNYMAISILKPTDMVAKKTLHYVNHFMVTDINKTISAQAMQMATKLNADLHQRTSRVMDKLRGSVDEDDKRAYEILSKAIKDLGVDEDDYVTDCRRKYELDSDEIMDRYTTYLSENRRELDNKFDQAHDDELSVYGVKVRGSYDTYQEADERCKFLRDNVERAVDVFVAPVGKWLPVNFDAYEVREQRHMLDALNNQMGKYQDSMRARDKHFEERKRNMIENSKKNNKLTTKERLQKKLRAKRNAMMKAELEKVATAGTTETKTDS